VPSQSFPEYKVCRADMSDVPGSLLLQPGVAEELQALLNPQASPKLPSGSGSLPWGPPMKLTKPQPPTVSG